MARFEQNLVREAAHRHRGVVNRQHQGERAKWGVRLGSESHEEKKRGEGGTWRLLTGGEAEWKGNQDQATRRKADGGGPGSARSGGSVGGCSALTAGVGW
jgi:hypothetical protein